MTTLQGSTRRRRRNGFRLGQAASAAVLLVVSSGCAPMETAVVADPGVAFSLALGKTAAVKGNDVRITFNRVNEDSRCPVDVQCVWAGDAKIELTISRNSSPVETKVISITPPNNEVVAGDLRIRFVGLAPAPRQSEPGSSRAYVAQLVVTPA